MYQNIFFSFQKTKKHKKPQKTQEYKKAKGATEVYSWQYTHGKNHLPSQCFSIDSETGSNTFYN